MVAENLSQEASETTLPRYASDDMVGVAGPDGEMIEGFRVSSKDLQEGSGLRIHERYRKAGLTKSPPPQQMAAFTFVEASPVVDKNDKLVGYFADRYYPLDEYERLLPAQEKVVDATGEGSGR